MAGREENDLTFLRRKELVFPAFAYVPKCILRTEPFGKHDLSTYRVMRASVTPLSRATC